MIMELKLVLQKLVDLDLGRTYYHLDSLLVHHNLKVVDPFQLAARSLVVSPFQDSCPLVALPFMELPLVIIIQGILMTLEEVLPLVAAPFLEVDLAYYLAGVLTFLLVVVPSFRLEVDLTSVT